MLRVVLDANVYVSAYVRPEGTPGRIIERFLRHAAFELVEIGEHHGIRFITPRAFLDLLVGSEGRR